MKLALLLLSLVFACIAQEQEIQGPRTSLDSGLSWEFSGCISPAANATRQCISAQGGVRFDGRWEWNMDTESELDCPEGTRGVWCAVKTAETTTLVPKTSSASYLSAFGVALALLSWI